MVVIQKRKGETKDAIFRKFSRAFMDEDIMNEVRKKQYYKKPSLQKKDDAKERIRDRARRRRYALASAKYNTFRKQGSRAR